jgi:hypothetical protein
MQKLPDTGSYDLRFKKFGNVGFAQLDPRPTAEADATNDAIFDAGQVLGIEVTIPRLAERCVLGNIDPQHSGGDKIAAIQAALEADSFWFEFGNDENRNRPAIIFATVRPDLDSIGAMVVLEARLLSWTPEPEPYGLPDYEVFDGGVARRIRAVAEFDKFENGKWPGRRLLPTMENPWPGGYALIEAYELAAVAACVSDFRLPLTDRVNLMKEWLFRGRVPEGYLEQVTAERQQLIAALARGDVNINVVGSAIVVVESTHRAATMIGYHYAPVVVAVNPKFRLGDGDEHRKFTICQYSVGHVDLQGVQAALDELEPGWGGSPTIVGSPQGVSSMLSVEKVAQLVDDHLM